MPDEAYTRIKSVEPEEFQWLGSMGTEDLNGALPIDEGWQAKRELGQAFTETASHLLEAAVEKKLVLEQDESLPPAMPRWPSTEHLQLTFRLLADTRLLEDGVGGMVAMSRLWRGGIRQTKEYRTFRSYHEHAARLIRSEAELGDDVEPWGA